MSDGSRYQDRDAAIFFLRLTGTSGALISKVFEISNSRVWQITQDAAHGVALAVRDARALAFEQRMSRPTWLLRLEAAGALPTERMHAGDFVGINAIEIPPS